MTGARYRIGCVARLTGVPVATLRMWERRYNAIVPARTDKGGRVYSEAEIERVILLKRNIAAGFPIGTIHDLSKSELQRRLQQHAASATGTPATVSVTLVGPGVNARLAPSSTPAGIHVVGRAECVDELDVDAVRGDVLVAEMHSLLPRMIERLNGLRQRHPAMKLVAVYRFAHPQSLERLREQRICAVRGPLDATQLEQICLQQCSDADSNAMEPPTVPDQVPARMFSDVQLAQLMSRHSGLQCLCPQHLADLLTALGAFESYSIGCESREDEDAALHGMLAWTTGRARHLMEQALERVLQHEGINL